MNPGTESLLDPQTGDRIQHRYVALGGKIKSVHGDWIKVAWDHPGIAVASLGVNCDLQRRDYLEPEGGRDGDQDQTA